MARACSWPRTPSLSRILFPLSPRKVTVSVVRSSGLRENASARERQRLKDQFKLARERCLTDPTDGVPFTVEEFLDALDQHDFEPQIGDQV